MPDQAQVAPEAHEADRLAPAEKASSPSNESTLLPLGVSFGSLADLKRLIGEVQFGDRSSRVMVASHLQHRNGNKATTALLRGVQTQRAPAATGAGPKVRELTFEELMDFVRSNPDQVLVTETDSGVREVFDTRWRSEGGKGEVAAFEDVSKHNVRVAAPRLAEREREEVFKVIRAHEEAKRGAAAARAAVLATEREAAGLADTGAGEAHPAGGAGARAETPPAHSAMGGHAGGGGAKTGSTEAKLGSADTKRAAAAAKGGGGGAAVPTVREITQDELVEIVKQHPERVLLTELEEGERLVFDNAWRSGGGRGSVVAFEEKGTSKIRINARRLTDPVRNEVIQILKQHHVASGEAAAAQQSVRHVERRIGGMSETPPAHSVIEDSAVPGTEAKTAGADAKLAAAETEVAGAEVKAEVGTAKVLGEAAEAGRAARLGGLLLELGLPGPWDVFFLFLSAFGSIAEARAELRARAFALGFGAGLSAILLNKDASEAAFRVATPSIPERVAGFEGTYENGHNEGLVAGHKFGKALNSKQRQGFLEELKKGLVANNTLKYLTGDFGRDSPDFATALRPTVEKLLEEAARQEEERRLRLQIEADQMRARAGIPKFRH